MSSLLALQQIQDITEKYTLYTSLINLVVGTVSNILMILIFTTLRTFRGNQCAFYLTVESVANISLLVAYLPSNIAGDILGRSPAQLSIVWCKIQLMSCYVFGFCSLFTIIFLSLDQYLSTNHRQSWRQISTIKLARLLTFFNVCFAILHNILFLVFAEIGTLGCTIYHPVAKTYFTFFYYPILGGIVPFIVSGVFSLLAYRNVRRIVRRQVPLVRRRLDHQMTAIALARVVCMIALGLPFVCISLYEFNLNNSENNDMEIAIYNLLSAIAHSLLYVNYAVSDVN